MEAARKYADKPPLEGLLSFFQVEDVADALRLSRWSIVSHVTMLADIANGVREGVKPSDSMAAADRLLKMAFEAAKMAGAIKETRQRTSLSRSDDDGRTMEMVQTSRAVSIASKATSATEEALRDSNRIFAELVPSEDISDDTRGE